MERDEVRRHENAAERHDQAARTHEDAVLFWREQLDDELAALEQRAVDLARTAAQLERDMARAWSRRAGSTSASRDLGSA